MKTSKCCMSAICVSCVLVTFALAGAFLLLLGHFHEQPELACAAEDEALCGSESDMAIIDTHMFARLSIKVGTQLYGENKRGSMNGVAAIENTLIEMSGQNASLSKPCVRCQAAALECAVLQVRGCFPACFKSCSTACKKCIDAACGARWACGGHPGISIQKPHTCPDGDKNNLQVDKSLFNETAHTVDCGGADSDNRSASVKGNFSREAFLGLRGSA